LIALTLVGYVIIDLESGYALFNIDHASKVAQAKARNSLLGNPPTKSKGPPHKACGVIVLPPEKKAAPRTFLLDWVKLQF
jgi:hypothetical protein